MTSNAIAQYRPQNKVLPKLMTLAEHAFCYVALVYFTSAYSNLVSYFAGEGASLLLGSLLRYGVLLGSFILIVFRWQLSVQVAKRGVLLWLLVAWAMLSWLWSESPGTTYLSIRGLLLPVVFFGLYFASRFSLKQQLKFLTIFFAGASLMSFFVVFAFPDLGRHPMTEFNGAWRGLFGHKNSLSNYMTLTLVLFLSSLLGKESEKEKIFPQKITWTGIVLIQFMILASNSKTGLFLSIFMIGFLLFYHRFRWFGNRSMLSLSFGLLVILTVVTIVGVNWATFWTAIGRDPTLTGRTEIWGGAIGYWFDKFWTGYGLDAFWDKRLPYSQTLGMAVTGVRRLVYTVPHSHNGYLDMVLALGFVGISLYLLTLAKAFQRAFRYAYLLPHSHLLFAVGFLVLNTTFNFVETNILQLVDFGFLLYMSIYLSLNLPERELDLSED
jgi:O-antigen ligase